MVEEVVEEAEGAPRRDNKALCLSEAIVVEAEEARGSSDKDTAGVTGAEL